MNQVVIHAGLERWCVRKNVTDLLPLGVPNDQL